MAPLFLLTDFGLDDHYVGVMKAVIAGIAPSAQVIDLSHAVAPQNVLAAAFTLGSSQRFLPPGSIVCAVVDPGVGSARRALAAELDLGDRRLLAVCPDNGLITPLLESARTVLAVALDDPAYQLPNASATFHGRDVFAPAAAHLATGVPLASLGSPLAPDDLERLVWPVPSPVGSGWRGAVVHIDRFGNLVTNLTVAELDGSQRWTVRLGERTVAGISTTFADVPVGAAVAYLGSGGQLELALRNAHAAERWRAQVGDPVLLEKG